MRSSARASAWNNPATHGRATNVMRASENMRRSSLSAGSAITASPTQLGRRIISLLGDGRRPAGDEGEPLRPSLSCSLSLVTSNLDLAVVSNDRFIAERSAPPYCDGAAYVTALA